jgi:hypothetical protein
MGWPLPRFMFPLVGCAVAIAVAIATRPLYLTPYATWHSVSAAWHESLAIPAALGAGLSAWVAAGLIPRRSPLSLPCRPRVGAAAVATHLSTLTAWALLGAVVGMAPLTAHAATTATWGQIRLLDVAVGLAGLALFIAVGFGVGSLVGSTKAAPLVSLTAFIAMNLPNDPTLRPLALVQPVQQFTAPEGFVPNPAVAWFTVLASLAGIVAVLATSDAFLGGRRRRSYGHYALGLSPIILIAIAFAWRPELYVHSGERHARVCRSVNGTTVCMHKAHSKSLPPVSRTVRALEEAGAAPLIDRVTGDALALRTPTGKGHRVISIRLTSSDPVAEQVAGLLSYVAQPPVCFSKSTGDAAIHAHDLGGLVRHRLLVDAGFAELADEVGTSASPSIVKKQQVLSGWSAQQFSTFVKDHAEDIAACQLNSEDFGSQ